MTATTPTIRGILIPVLAAAFFLAPMSVAIDGGYAWAKSEKAENNAGKNKGNKGNKGKSDDTGERLEDEIADEVLDGVFGEDDREIIERYVRERGVAAKSLPPGIAKNVQRGKPLPPGIAKRGLPSDLEGRLPPLREGLERVIAGDDVTIVEEGTRVVVDVLKDVLSKQ